MSPSTFDRKARRSQRRIDREQEGIREAIRNCREGNFHPEGYEWGLPELLTFVGYDPTSDFPIFVSDKLAELEHDLGLPNAKLQILRWYHQDKRAAAVVEAAKGLRIAAHGNYFRAMALVRKDLADLMMLIGVLDTGDGRPVTAIICRNEQIAQRFITIFSDIEGIPKAEGDGTISYFLEGSGSHWRDLILDKMPRNDSWSYVDYRYNEEPDI